MKKRQRRYPRHLVPHKKYKITPVDADLDDFYLLRYMSNDNTPLGSKEIKDVFPPSRFYCGMSVNLLSKYRKCDVRYYVNPKKHRKCFENWEEGKAGILPSEFSYYKKRPFVGIKVDGLRSAELDIQIGNAKPSIRRDKVFFRIEHCPVMSNFWHFNIFLYGENSVTGEMYRLHEAPNVSKNKVQTTASKLIQQIAGDIVDKDQMKAKYLPKRFYTIM